MSETATPERPANFITPFPAIGGGRGSEVLAFYERGFLAEVTERKAAACTVKIQIADRFRGDRYGTVIDPPGHHWSIGSKLAR